MSLPLYDYPLIHRSLGSFWLLGPLELVGPLEPVGSLEPFGSFESSELSHALPYSAIFLSACAIFTIHRTFFCIYSQLYCLFMADTMETGSKKPVS